MAANLYPYQRDAVDFLHSRNGKAGLFMEMGTGKTRVALTYLKEAGARRVLVVCPVAAASVWRREIRKLRLPWRGRNLTRRTMAQRERELRLNKDKLQVVLINYNVLWQPTQAAMRSTKPAIRNRARAQRRLVQAVEAFSPDSVILDEAHRIKGRSSRQSLYAASLARKVRIKHRLALTGTPVTKGLEDLFGIYRFIDPEVFGTRWRDFADRYITFGGYYGYEITGYTHTKEVRRKVKRTAYIISKRKALDLPPRRTVVIDVDLSPRSQKRYEQFRKEAVAEIEGLDENGKPKRGYALARIVLTQLTRLRQLSSGFINTDEGELDVSNEKTEICLDLLQDALASGQQVVIFCLYTHDVTRLAAKIKGSLTYTGQNKRERERNKELFQAGKCKVLIVQISSGSESIDLSAGSIGIFYSYDENLTSYAQARDRLHRHGQKKKVTYYILRAANVKGSVDVKTFEALGNKQDIARHIGRLDYARRLLA